MNRYLAFGVAFVPLNWKIGYIGHNYRNGWLLMIGPFRFALMRDLDLSDEERERRDAAERDSR